MRVEVQLLNEKGRSIRASDRVAMPKYHGLLRIGEDRSQQLGRISITAQLLSMTDGAPLPLLTELTDATVLSLKDGMMRVRGFEVENGIQYGQTWDVKVS